ncbi:MAG TPA: hypothetical protein VGB97_04585 [Candidatus Paceibacterota bacterium]|jgi:hypothetical protein
MTSTTIRWTLAVVALFFVATAVRTLTPSVYDVGTVGPEDQVLLQSEVQPQPGATQFRGAWRLSEAAKAKGPQGVLIDCRKEKSECALTQVSIWQGDYFYQEIGYYVVTDWTDEGAITATQDGKCTNAVLTADTRTASARITTTSNAAQAETCNIPESEMRQEWVLDYVDASPFAKVRQTFYDSWYELSH